MPQAAYMRVTGLVKLQLPISTGKEVNTIDKQVKKGAEISPHIVEGIPFIDRFRHPLGLVSEADSEDDSPVCTPNLRQGSLGVQNAESLTIQILDCGKNVGSVDHDAAMGVWFRLVSRPRAGAAKENAVPLLFCEGFTYGCISHLVHLLVCGFQLCCVSFFV